MVVVVLLLDAMVASPDLHELIHHDADTPGHECAVTMLAHGQADSPVVDVAAILPVTPDAFLQPAMVSAFVVRVESLLPGRGPPVSLLPS